MPFPWISLHSKTQKVGKLRGGYLSLLYIGGPSDTLEWEFALWPPYLQGAFQWWHVIAVCYAQKRHIEWTSSSYLFEIFGRASFLILLDEFWNSRMDPLCQMFEWSPGVDPRWLIWGLALWLNTRPNHIWKLLFVLWNMWTHLATLTKISRYFYYIEHMARSRSRDSSIGSHFSTGTSELSHQSFDKADFMKFSH